MILVVLHCSMCFSCSILHVPWFQLQYTMLSNRSCAFSCSILHCQAGAMIISVVVYHIILVCMYCACVHVCVCVCVCVCVYNRCAIVIFRTAEAASQDPVPWLTPQPANNQSNEWILVLCRAGSDTYDWECSGIFSSDLWKCVQCHTVKALPL